MSEPVPAVIGLGLSAFLIVYGHKAQHEVDFLISALIAGSFFYSHITPYFDPNMPVFGLLASLVIGLGALVGGVIGILLPKIGTGIAIGFLLALAIEVATYGDAGYASGFLSSIIFISAIAGFVFAAQKLEDLCSLLRTALATGLVFALSVDFFLDGALLAAVSRVLRMRSYDSSLCYVDCYVPALLGTWCFVSLIAFTVQSNQRGMWKKWCSKHGAFNYVALGSPAGLSDSGSNAKQRTFTYPDTLEFNYFDPDNLPEVVYPFGEVVFTTVQSLAAQYGFQVDSSRNQAEHMLMILVNERLPSDKNLTDAARRVHAKLFANYRKWCDRMGVAPRLCVLQAPARNGLYPRDSPSDAGSYIADILLHFLVWGEAANLKHMPEAICFLYHKCKQEHKQFASLSAHKEMYPGYFLDMVITPLYEVVASGLSKKTDHNEKKTYDDYNEFFWAPSCMQCRITDTAPGDTETGMATCTVTGPMVSQALHAASKTYVEKRSWLHPLLSMHRIFEWHAITFTLLMLWAFSNRLVWSYCYTLKIGSFVFWEITFFGIVWTCLEVWTLFPHATIPGPSICGYLIRLLAGFLVLVYQSVYFHWAFRDDAVPGTGMRGQGDANFWWWQYIWLSLVSSSLYLLQSVLCWFPSSITFLMTWNNDLVQAVLNICYPLSQEYVGKKTDMPQAEVFRYILFWLTLLAFKLWFGYRYIVNPVTVPSLELFDDYMNFQQVSFVKTAGLFFVWWFPHYLVYLIDLSIWYSMWTSVVGGFIALVERQGAVRDQRTFRSHFMRAPLAFCQKIMPSSSKVNFTSRGVAASRVDLTKVTLSSSQQAPSSVRGAGGTMVAAKPSALASTGLKKAAFRARSSADLQAFLDESSVETTSTAAETELRQRVESFLGDDVGQRWVIFARVWNDVIKHLRESDHLNNAEKEMYLFSTFDWLSKPVYLPLFQTAGCVEVALYAYKNAAADFVAEQDVQKKIQVVETFSNVTLDLTAKEAVSEAWELASWVLQKLMGSIHSQDIFQIADTFSMWVNSSTGDLFTQLNPDSMASIVNNLANIIGQLKGGVGKRHKAPVVTSEVLAKQTQDATDKSYAKSSKATNATTPPPGSTVDKSFGLKRSLKKSVSTGFLAGLGSGDSSSDLAENPSDAGVAGGGGGGAGVDAQKKRFTKLQPFRKEFVLQDNLRDKLREEVKSLLNNLRNALRVKSGVTPAGKDAIDRITFVLSMENGFLWNDVYASKQLDDLAKDLRTASALNKLNGLLRLRQTQVTPASAEALRRMNFFVNSLFMDMPLVPTTRYVKEYTCMTPFYGEDVLLTRDDLEEKNSDGISTLLYLQTLYKKDWMNFLERRGLGDDHSIWSARHLQETRMWASLRAQTLFRTIEGMMHSEAAIRLIAELEKASAADTEVFAKLKFNYVVACQIYGQMRKNLEHKADDIEFLLARHPNLRVAYIDATRATRDGEVGHYSVLIKHDANPLFPPKNGFAVKEVYRVKLPGNPVLGEGKPENQNHAIIFSRGRYLQAIDMNQDGYFEEALKMRNLVQEFDSGVSILGFREHIFTGSVSSVANYMALQELSFVTLGQRVLAKPLSIRQHYGHPDLFDKFFVMTEGGMSKASKGINLSEDVFAGFNATIRGHSVGFKEYAQVGKGRDVGLQQTYKFEAKLSQGNAEQSLSRDMARICDRLDFFRLMSFYYGGIGHYMANTMVMFTLVLVVYTMVALAIYGEEGVNGRPMHPEGVLQLLLSGLGLLQTMPLAVTLTVEKGILAAVTEIAYMMLSGGPLYFIFHIQTKCYYFQQTLLAGGAMYRPTGRGFVIRHSPFDENFRFFASSHIHLGFELCVALILFALYTKSKQYGGLTWSLWLTSVSFLLGPFWFNPVTFEWGKCYEDYVIWDRWMSETGGSSEQSWIMWWREENSFFKSLSVSWKFFLIVQKSCLWVFVACGLLGGRFLRDTAEHQRLLEVLGVFAIFALGSWCLGKLERSLSYAVRRFATLSLCTVVAAVLVYLYSTHTLYFRYTVAVYYMLSAASFLLLLCGFTPISHAYKLHDYLVGHSLFFVIAVLSTLQIGVLQTWLLYHNALEKGVVIEDVLKFARKSKERAGEEVEDMHQLRAQVAEQERTIKMLLDTMRHSGQIGDGTLLGQAGQPSGVELTERSSLLGGAASRTPAGARSGSNSRGGRAASGSYGSVALNEDATRNAVDVAVSSMAKTSAQAGIGSGVRQSASPTRSPKISSTPAGAAPVATQQSAPQVPVMKEVTAPKPTGPLPMPIARTHSQQAFESALVALSPPEDHLPLSLSRDRLPPAAAPAVPTPSGRDLLPPMAPVFGSSPAVAQAAGSLGAGGSGLGSWGAGLAGRRTGSKDKVERVKGSGSKTDLADLDLTAPAPAPSPEGFAFSSPASFPSRGPAN